MIISNKKKLKLGIIGFGKIVEEIYYPALLGNEAIEIAGAADISGERISSLKETLPHLQVYSNYRDLFSSCALDAVLIATPPYAHAEAICEAYKSGIHILSEKPIVAHEKELDLIQGLIKKQTMVIFPVHNYKIFLSVQRMKEFIAKGEIGTVENITIEMRAPSHRLGVDEWMPHWRRKREYSGGGIIIDYAPHFISLASHFYSEIPKKAVAFFTAIDKQWGDEVEDNAVLRVEYPSGYAHINLSWRKDADNYLKFFIQGSKGFIEGNKQEVRLYSPLTGSKKEELHFYPDSNKLPNWGSSVLSDFYKAIIEKNFKNGEMIEALNNMKLVFDVYSKYDMD